MGSAETSREIADIRLGVVRGISHGLFGAPLPFGEAARSVGARSFRAYLYWSQVEPEPGRRDWGVVDHLLAQARDDDELWITVCSSSTWATERATDFLPPSPARDLERYRRFVAALVERCRGRVRFWQCDNEPSVPLLWAGTAAAYVRQLRVFAGAVRTTDPGALVVLGGCPFGVVAPGGEAHDREYWTEILRDGEDAFDVFDVHLYGDPYAIPEMIERCRRWMAELGYQRPVVAGEYSGPSLFEFPEAFGVLAPAMSDLMRRPAGDPETGSRTAPAEEPAMIDLYARMAQLPPSVQMFMEGCPPALEERRQRWAARDLVMRNLLALSMGVRRTMCWNLAPEAPVRMDPRHLMTLLFDKFKLLEYEGRKLTGRHPAADTLARLSDLLRGATSVRRVDGGSEAVYAFEVEREGRGPLLAAWRRHDGWDGEERPARPWSHPWSGTGAVAIDALGNEVPVKAGEGELRLPLGLTPVLVR